MTIRKIGMQAALCAACTACAAADISFTAANTEIVVAPNAPLGTQFAAREMKAFLDRALGADVRIATAFSSGKNAIVLGTNGWSAAAGIDVASRPRDTFVIKAAGDRLYIVGRDPAKLDPGKIAARGRGTDQRSLARSERATAFGVYEFLERFAGCRFYFPGEMGEIVPKADAIRVPDGTLIERAPAFTQRSVSLNSPMRSQTGSFDEKVSLQLLNWIRLRLETDHLQCGHGLNSMDYARRFADSHPEYFCLRNDGKRATLKVDPNPKSQSHCVGQLCHTSDVWNEITEDVLSYFRGEPGERRLGKGHGWGKNLRGVHADVMPQDGMWKCHCEKCLAAYDDGPDYANTLIWGRTCTLARRVKAEGLNGRIAQMAYRPYSKVPSMDIPENVDVMVATAGPWSMRDQEYFEGGAGGHENGMRGVRGWAEKLGRPVWLWTYPGKVNAMNLPAAPQIAPHAWGHYYKKAAPYIFGAFNEAESDSFAFNYLNYYVFSRVAWDVNADVDAIIAEHHRLMYGGGASAMARLFDRLEDVWLHKVICESATTSTGGEPAYEPPGPYDLLMKVYTPKLLGELAGYVNEALAAVPKGSIEARRIAFADAEIVGPIRERAGTFHKARSVGAEMRRRAEAKAMSSVPAAAKWWARLGSRVDGDAVTFNVKPGMKAMLSLKAAKIALKPNTRYRASCFLSADLNELPFRQVKKGNGLVFELSEGSSRKRLYRVTGIFGKHEREAWGFDFTTGSEIEDGGYFALHGYGVEGTVRLDGLCVYELK